MDTGLPPNEPHTATEVKERAPVSFFDNLRYKFSDLVLPNKQRAVEVPPNTELNQKRRFWLWEVWLERRDFFKELVGDALSIAAVVTILMLIHWVLERSGLPGDVKGVIDKLHTYSLIILLGIIGLSSIIKVVLRLASEIRHDASALVRAGSKQVESDNE